MYENANLNNTSAQESVGRPGRAVGHGSGQ
jgi:hypothetical protein